VKEPAEVLQLQQLRLSQKPTSCHCTP
jgi:hypothetical protein